VDVHRLSNDDSGSALTVSPGARINLALEAAPGVRYGEPQIGDPAILAVTTLTRDTDGSVNAQLTATDVGETWISVVFQPLRMISRTRPLRVWRATVRIEHPRGSRPTNGPTLD
jgi:hypothetical protein